jgi:predicted phage terminase large subunit-like protein
MQRLHEDDLAGHLLRQGGWQHLDLPAIAIEDSIIATGQGKQKTRCRGDVLHAERESQEVLDRIKTEIGSLMFSAQYQQRPVPVEGNLIKRAWFSFYDQPPEPAPGHLVVQSWDIAMMTGDANDYSVCTTWRMVGPDYYLIEVFRGRLQYPDLRRKIASLATRHAAGTVLIENAGPGMTLLQDLRHDLPDGMTRPIGVKPEGSKTDRMAVEASKIEAGHVHLPKEADWLDNFLLELLAFPKGRHDDQVDSVSQFLKWAAMRRYREEHTQGVGLPIAFELEREPGFGLLRPF